MTRLCRLLLRFKAVIINNFWNLYMKIIGVYSVTYHVLIGQDIFILKTILVTKIELKFAWHLNPKI